MCRTISAGSAYIGPQSVLRVAIHLKDVNVKEIRFYVSETEVEQPKDNDDDDGHDNDKTMRGGWSASTAADATRAHSSDEEDEEKGGHTADTDGDLRMVIMLLSKS